MIQHPHKLKLLRQALQQLNKEHYWDISKRVPDTKLLLEKARGNIMNGAFDAHILEQDKQLCEQYFHRRADEESFLKQKARVCWLALGDSNTAYFHKLVRVHLAKNTIKLLYSNDGRALTTPSDIAHEAVGFYTTLLGQADVCASGSSISELRDILSFRVSAEHWALLLGDVSTDEIKTALWSMDGNRAPGPDGYNVHFFKSSWSIVGADFIRAVRSFFSSGRLLTTVNCTSLTLVPKVPNPTCMTDFRPIACCTVVYKCVSKILVNRLKLFIPDFISLNQSAFVQNRSNGGNILKAHELVKGYHRVRINPRCAIKADIMKAFDSVSWAFVLNVLAAINVPEKFIWWIEACVTGAKYMVNVNGGLEGFIARAKGLRQGDPLSPYLFVMAIEVLSRLLDSAAQGGELEYHPTCKKVGLTHLAFADDLLIFLKGTPQSLRVVLDIFDRFYGMSGLKLNPRKTELYCGGLSVDEVQALAQLSSFTIGKLSVRYLGVPLVSGRLSDRDGKPLIEKITGRLEAWAMKKLSYAGRLQLIQSLIHSLVNFWCTAFILPIKVTRSVEQKCKSFLWKGDATGSRGGAKVNWSVVCLSRVKGGLGIKDLGVWNKACSLKLIWLLLRRAGSLWIAWLAAYVIKGRSFWDVHVPSFCSYAWWKLFKLRHIAYPLFKVQIGDGHSALFWMDNWHVKSPLDVCFKNKHGLSPYLTVAEAVRDTHWQLQPFRDRCSWELQSILRGIHLSTSKPDVVLWRGFVDGKFSIANAWRAL